MILILPCGYAEGAKPNRSRSLAGGFSTKCSREERRMNGNRWAIALVAVTVLLAGCGAAADNAALEGTEWALVTLSGQAPLPGRPPSAEFTAGEISGIAGCNTYFGTYDIKGTEITISDLANTECGARTRRA
jgi:hypothetical protein